VFPSIFLIFRILF